MAKLERIQKRGISPDERAEIVANKRALLGTEPAPPAAPAEAAKPEAPADGRDRTMERTTLYVPAYVALQLRVKAATEKGTNISRLVLRALRSEGIEVEDCDLHDQRGRGPVT
jgi:uncharacterized protein YijF (DUF1287 family)